MFKICPTRFPCFFYHLKNGKRSIFDLLIDANANFYGVKEVFAAAPLFYILPDPYLL
jgi:hypothetical protein